MSEPTTPQPINPTRTLNVVIPVAAHRQARVAAAASDLSFKHYIARLLSQAKPFPLDGREHPPEPHHQSN
jgi:predicted HicB family RNase H-like nuclease